MPARVVIVHDDPVFVEALADTLRRAGHDFAVFTNPVAALDALESAHRIEVLITRLFFGQGRQNGQSLALMGKVRRPGLRVVFAAEPEFAALVSAEGDVFQHPVDIAALAARVREILAAQVAIDRQAAD